MGGKRANQNDVAIGQQIRVFRMQAKMSQTELADKLGVTFQQVQKYEKGTNRVGSGRLPQLAAALGVPITAFSSALYSSTMHCARLAKFFESSGVHQSRRLP